MGGPCVGVSTKKSICLRGEVNIVDVQEAHMLASNKIKKQKTRLHFSHTHTHTHILEGKNTTIFSTS